MEYLLTPKNLKVLESFSIVKTLYAFDYDGTLAPINPEPSQAFMQSKVKELLRNLSEIATVAIITGRSIQDVKTFFDFEPQFIIGNHGIEGTHSENELTEMSELVSEWKRKLTNLPPGVTMEEKNFSLSLHHRTDISPLMSVLEDLPGATLIGGKNVLNIIPRIGINKGQALDYLMNKHAFNFGFYIGDDKTDENVFAYKNSRLFTVKVGLDDQSMAKYYINSQTEIESLLVSLIQFQKRLS